MGALWGGQGRRLSGIVHTQPAVGRFATKRIIMMVTQLALSRSRLSSAVLRTGSGTVPSQQGMWPHRLRSPALDPNGPSRRTRCPDRMNHGRHGRARNETEGSTPAGNACSQTRGCKTLVGVDARSIRFSRPVGSQSITVDRQARQSPLQLFNSQIGDLSAEEVELREVGDFLEIDQPRVSNSLAAE